MRKAENHDSLIQAYYPIFPAIFFLTLTKEIGMIYALFTIPFVFLLEWELFEKDSSSLLKIKEMFRTNKENIKKIILISLILVLIIIFAYFSWKIYLKSAGVSYEAIFSNQVFTIGRYGGPSLNRSLSNYSIPDVLRNLIAPAGDNRIVANNFISKFEESANFNFMQISFKTSLLLLLVLIGTSLILLESRNRNLFIKANLVLLVELILFLYFLLFTYMYVISIKGVDIPSFKRYVYPSILSFATVLLWYVFNHLSSRPFKQNTQRDKLLNLLLFILLTANLYKISWGLVGEAMFRYEEKFGNAYETTIIAKEYNQIIPEDSRVFHIRRVQDEEDRTHVILKYEMWPRVFQFFGYGFVTEGEANKKYNENSAVIASPQELFDAIKIGQYDYVLITSADEEFWQDYAEIFDVSYAPNEHCLYAVGSDRLILITGQDEE